MFAVFCFLMTLYVHTCLPNHTISPPWARSRVHWDSLGWARLLSRLLGEQQARPGAWTWALTHTLGLSSSSPRPCQRLLCVFPSTRPLLGRWETLNKYLVV